MFFIIQIVSQGSFITTKKTKIRKREVIGALPTQTNPAKIPYRSQTRKISEIKTFPEYIFGLIGVLT
jgi:hypothetical protein